MTEETLFTEALARPPEERPAFLAEADAGDTELQERVEQLLKPHEEAGAKRHSAGFEKASPRSVRFDIEGRP